MNARAVLAIALVAGVIAISLAMIFSQPQAERGIISGPNDAGSLQVVFENATNLTENNQDSVYGQVAAWNSSVYVIWQDSVSGRNYDVFVKKSIDNGTNFGKPVNISNNPGFSEHPQLSVYGDSVYALWVDNTPGNREVLFAKSADGATFEDAVNLSGDGSDSHNQEMAAFEGNVYVVWADRDDQENLRVLFSASHDGGATFGEAIGIGKAGIGSYPKVAADGDEVYVAWNVIGRGESDGLYFAKSSDAGATFEDAAKIGESAGESQVAAYNGTVYIISGGLAPIETGGLLLFKSTDGGETFAEPMQIDASGQFVNPTNVELVADGHDSVYVAGQVHTGSNEEILLLPISGGNATGVVNLSNNEKISECPSIAMAGDHIYVVWEDLTPGNHEVLYAKGTKT